MRMHVPHLGKKLRVLAATLTVMLLAGIAAGLRARSAGASQIEFFDVEQRDFVAESHNIRRMEVWLVPQGAQSETQWKTLGLMKGRSHWFSWAAWTLPIPEKPLDVLQIMVRGYDKTGTEVDRVSLPWLGPETLKREVWGMEIN